MGPNPLIPVSACEVTMCQPATPDRRSGDVRLVDALAALRQATATLVDIDPADLTGHGLGGQVVDLLKARRQLDAATAVLAERFTHTGEAEADKAKNPHAWLTAKVSDAPGTLRSHPERAQLLAQYPVILAAWQAGRLSGRHVDALRTVHAKYPALRSALAKVQEHLATLAEYRNPRQFEQRLLAICHQADPVAVSEEDTKQRKETFFHISPIMDGLVKVDALLPAELGAALINAIDSAKAALRRENTRDSDDEGARADEEGPADYRRGSTDNLAAFGRLLAAASAATNEWRLPDVQGDRPTIHATIALDSLQADLTGPAETGEKLAGVLPGWLERGGMLTWVLTALAAQVLACDSVIEPVIVDKMGRLLATLPRSRTIPKHLRRAVLMRDQWCRFPGCHYSIDEVHHIVYWSQGGLTVLSNLMGLCWHHHDELHRQGWVVTGDPNGVLGFDLGNGRIYTSHPALAA